MVDLFHPEVDYHLSVEVSISGFSGPRTAFVGSGSSARLMGSLMKQTLRRLAQNRDSLPLPSVLGTVTEDIIQTPMLSLSIDHRKLDFSSSIPPSTQRSLICHYLKVVQFQYPLLSPEQEANFIEQEIPLLYSRRKGEHIDQLAITAVLAISSALVARDIDFHFSGVALFYRELLRKIAEETISRESQTAPSLGTVVALCFLTIDELIYPTIDQAWELVGRALASMEQNQNNCAFPELDGEYRRLKLCLIRLER